MSSLTVLPSRQQDMEMVDPSRHITRACILMAHSLDNNARMYKLQLHVGAAASLQAAVKLTQCAAAK